MKIVDANVLIYAVNEDAEHHARSKEWLDSALSGGATVGLCWMALLAFVRIVTNDGLFPHPLTVAGAFERVEAWLVQPSALVVQPTSRHASIMRDLLSGPGVSRGLISDAHLAALAVEHQGTVVSYDREFQAFVGVKWEQPKP